MTRIVGIDLGTTNSCVAVMEGGRAVVIPNEIGARTTPSVVAWTKEGIIVGAAAKRQAVANPTSTLRGVKRLIGRTHASAAVREIEKTLPYALVAAPNGDAWVSVEGNAMSPPEVSAHVLRHLKKIAEDYLDEKVTEAIVTVPAYFDDAQRQATKDAGTIAGLNVRAILNEPTAAALAYGVDRPNENRVLAVFDLGGGTFDVSILRLQDGVFTVLATSGDTALGGDDFDRVVVSALASEFQAETGVDLSVDPAALARLKEAVEQAKHELSAIVETEIRLPFMGVGEDGPVHLNRVVTREWLESKVAHLLSRLDEPCVQALSDAGLTAEAIDQVILVGGMTRMPAVQEKVAAAFGKKPVKGVHPDEVVALGAATQSGMMTGQLDDVILLDVTSHALGIGIVGDKMSVIVARNTSVPTRAKKIFKTTSDGQDHVVIEIFQGQSQSVSDNRMLGRFILGDLTSAPAGTVQVEVRFTVDADGILSVDATEIQTGKSTSKKVLASSGLSRADVDRLVQGSADPGS